MSASAPTSYLNSSRDSAIDHSKFLHKQPPARAFLAKASATSIRQDNLEQTQPQTTTTTMCFYDQTVFCCGDFKWGNCKQQCPREYRSGETCGMKLVMNCYPDNTSKCKTCSRIDTITRKREKECANIRTWQKDEKAGKKRSASIEKAYNAIQEYDGELSKLYHKLQAERQSLNGKS